jgi:hypothetical protein
VNTRRALAIIAASPPNGLAAESLGHADVRETTLQRSAARGPDLDPPIASASARNARARLLSRRMRSNLSKAAMVAR